MSCEKVDPAVYAAIDSVSYIKIYEYGTYKVLHGLRNPPKIPPGFVVKEVESKESGVRNFIVYNGGDTYDFVSVGCLGGDCPLIVGKLITGEEFPYYPDLYIYEDQLFAIRYPIDFSKHEGDEQYMNDFNYKAGKMAVEKMTRLVDPESPEEHHSLSLIPRRVEADSVKQLDPVIKDLVRSIHNTYHKSSSKLEDEINKRLMILGSLVGEVEKVSVVDPTIEYMRELERKVKELESYKEAMERDSTTHNKSQHVIDNNPKKRKCLV